jgi:membrane-bound serine protease (ClpP class)
VFFILAIVLLVFLDSPWNVVGAAAALVLFGGEVAFWNRTVKGRRVGVGAETLIGSEAKVVVACQPDGQVHTHGEIWAARCAAGAERGETVRVVGRNGLTLVVERLPAG